MANVVLVVSLIVGAATSYFLGPRLATALHWPLWLAYVLIFVDIVLVFRARENWGENVANIHLAQRRWTQEFADYPPSYAVLAILGLVVVPILALIALLIIVAR